MKPANPPLQRTGASVALRAPSAPAAEWLYRWAAKRMDTEKVRRFWSWFADSRRALEVGPKDERSRPIRELDRRVRDLDPRLSWEVGPGEAALNMLAISPAGDCDLLRLTEAIIEMAPPAEGWEFHAAKPPKQWKNKTRTFTYDGITIDASDWKYGLTAFNHREFFDIVWLVPNLEPLHGLDSRDVADFVLENEVGERERILRFDSAEIVARDSIDPGLPVSPISVLRAHLAQLTSA